MPPDQIILWLAGIGVPIMILSQWRLGTMIRRLITMHEQPDAYGFGTGGIREQQTKIVDIAKSQLRATQELIYYTKWAAKNSNGGTEPPPYVGNPET